MPSIEDAARRLSKRNPGLTPERASHLAEFGTEAVTGGVSWKWDPMHLTRSPLGFQLDRARQSWSRITCPTLLVSGSESGFGYAEAGRREEIPHAKAVEIRDAGHMVHYDQPEVLAETVLAFLDPVW